MKDIVFIGPSLSLTEAKNICQADFRSPAKMGDVYQAALEKPRSITIIDGLFERVPAVWHKEILFALNQGIPVIGGSSMGALRAAELNSFGMVGIGEIYQKFASGELIDDDEVAVVHGTNEDEHSASSIAMVNIRFGLSEAIKQNIITEEQSRQLINLSKERYYPERNWKNLLHDCLTISMQASSIQALERMLTQHTPDLKKNDAIAVLKKVAQLQQEAPNLVESQFEFQHTVYWDAVESYYAPHKGPGSDSEFSVNYERIRNHVRLFEADRERIREKALLMFLVEQEARRLRLRQRDDREVLNRMRTKKGLKTAQSLSQWMSNANLTREQCLRLARVDSLIADLSLRHVLAVDSYLDLVLKEEGRLQNIVANVVEKWRLTNDMSSIQFNENSFEDFDKVLQWYQQRHGEIYQGLEQHANEMGIGSMHQLREELYVEYMANAH